VSESKSHRFFRDNKSWFLPVIIVVPILILAFLLFCCLFGRRLRRGYSPTPNEYTNRYRNRSPKPWWNPFAKRNIDEGVEGRESSLSQNGLMEHSIGPVTTSPFLPYSHYQPIITPGSYPHGRPLSPVEEIRSRAGTPALVERTMSPTQYETVVPGGTQQPYVIPRRPVPENQQGYHDYNPENTGYTSPRMPSDWDVGQPRRGSVNRLSATPLLPPPSSHPGPGYPLMRPTQDYYEDYT